MTMFGMCRYIIGDMFDHVWYVHCAGAGDTLTGVLVGMCGFLFLTFVCLVSSLACRQARSFRKARVEIDEPPGASHDNDMQTSLELQKSACGD